MSTIIVFKNSNGIVMGADSAVTFKSEYGVNVFPSYFKLNQVGDLPIVTAMWGAGSVGGMDIPTNLEEFYYKKYQNRLPVNWNIKEVARQIYEFFKQKYDSDCGCKKSPLGMIIGGFSKGNFLGELYEFVLPDSPLSPLSGGVKNIISWRGAVDAILTQWWGYAPGLNSVLKKHGIDDTKIKEILSDIKKQHAWGPERINFNMPLEEAAKLVEYLLNLQIGKEYFLPGEPASTPPVDIVIINHNWVKWVKGKRV